MAGGVAVLTSQMTRRFRGGLDFSRQFLVHGKIAWKVPGFPSHAAPSHARDLPGYQHPAPGARPWLRLMNPRAYLTGTQSPQCTSGVTLGVAHSKGLHKRAVTRSCPSTPQSSFIGLKILCAPPGHSPRPSDPFTVSTVLPLPECYRIEIIQNVNVTFSNWPSSLSNMHVRCLRVFSRFEGSLLFSPE